MIGLGLPLDFEKMFPPVKTEGLDTKVLKRIYAANKKATREAIKAFVYAVARKIRVDTGMSKGSLMPLAPAVRIASGIGITPKRTSRRGYTDMNGMYRGPDSYRTRALGEHIGAGSYQIDWGSYKKQIISFFYQINIYQWAFHENEWDALAFGEYAYVTTWSDRIAKHLPPEVSKGATLSDWFRIAV